MSFNQRRVDAFVNSQFDAHEARGCDFDFDRPDFRPTRGVPSTPSDSPVPMSELEQPEGAAFDVAEAPEAAPVEFDSTEFG